MKICKNCRTRMDDSHSVCPECNCESFETEEVLNDGNTPEIPENTVANDSPTRIIDVIKVDEDSAEEDKNEPHVASGEEDFQKTPKKVKPWLIGVIIGIAVVVLGVVIAVLSGAFSGTNRYYNNAEIETPADIVTKPVDAVINNTPYVMTEKPFDLQIKIEQSVYQLPMLVKDVLSSGWALGDSAVSDTYLASGEALETYFVSANGSIIFVTVKNFDKNDAQIKDCCLIGLKVDVDCLSGEKTLLVKDLAMGSTRKAVEDVFGECDDVTKENKGITLLYTKSDEKYASFIFDAEAEKMISVAYFNDTVPDEFEALTEKTEENDKNDEDYSKPISLGNDVTAGVIQVDGELYKFPIPVSEFLDNGWEITLDEGGSVVSAEEHLFGVLKKGDVEIAGVDVYNFEESESRVKNCYVVSIEDSTDSGNGIALPKNVKAGMSEEAFLQAVNGLDYDFDSTHFNEYIFTRGAYTLVIDVDKDEKTIVYWYATYDVAYEE